MKLVYLKIFIPGMYSFVRKDGNATAEIKDVDDKDSSWVKNFDEYPKELYHIIFEII